MPNVELLELTMQHIKDHPETHRQALWVNMCGTKACFAGWAGLFSGMSIDEILDEDMIDRGAKLLGIELNDALILFDGYNSRDTLELMVKRLINGEHLTRFRE